MLKADPLIRTKLRMPFTRPGLVLRPRLQEQIAQGLRRPLTLITAPAGFGKTTLVAACIANYSMPVAWLSLDKDDNQAGRFLSYIIAALQEVDQTIGSKASQLLAASEQAPVETILTNLINDLDTSGKEIILVLDDYQFISDQDVHEEVTFLLEHSPKPFHLVIASRSDPPLPLARLRARGQTVELRAADLRFTEPEATQFLNDVMGLQLDARAVAALAERTEGWIAGLQMAALSMRDREDVLGFIEGFSGTNRYILDYLLEEVLASQPPEIQHFLMHTSILERMTAPLCEYIAETLEHSNVTTFRRSNEILEYLERANLFVVPLDDERIWYRYHHLFADLLHARLQKTLGDQTVERYHLRASEWYEQNGMILDAIHHASLASDFERIERLIEQNYFKMSNRGEASWVRYWMGKLSKDLVYRRPWLCLYEAFSRSWFGQLEEANFLLKIAENRIRSEASAPDTQVMLGYHAYVQSRITAMQGDTRRAIELCLTARANTPADNLALQNEMGITLGYEYFLYGDFMHASRVLGEAIQQYYNVGAINNPVAAFALLARMHIVQGVLHEAHDLYQWAAQMIHEAGGQHFGAIGLVEVGIAALSCEWNDLEAALARVKQGLDYLPLWGKTDDLCLAYTTLSRIQLARGDRAGAVDAIEKAAQLIRTCGVFSETRSLVETTQVKMWLLQGDWSSIDRWSATLEKRFASHEPFHYEDELTQLTQARVLIAQNKPEEAIRLLSCLEESAQSGGRTGRLIEIMILRALAMQRIGEPAQAEIALMTSLALAAPSGYVRIFLDEGQPVQSLLAKGLAHASAGPLRDYAIYLLSKFETGLHGITAAQEKASPTGDLVEPLSQRELEVLHLIALGMRNQEIAKQLIVSPGTVKAHTASIYRKLGVANRTEAVRRASQLGILP